LRQHLKDASESFEANENGIIDCMSGQTIDRTIQSESSRPSEGLFSLEKGYARTITALNQSGILTLLPRSESSGVVARLRIISTPTYHGETGWTPEDFLTHFVTQLETTDQVSHDRYDTNALWLLGSYMPDSGFGLGKLVPVGYWARVRGKLDVSAHRSANRLRGWVARSMVRLGA
jgi:hypothetical protein